MILIRKVLPNTVIFSTAASMMSSSRICYLYLNAQNQTSSRELKIAIIGAGATGVELAAELVIAKQNFLNMV